MPTHPDDRHTPCPTILSKIINTLNHYPNQPLTAKQFKDNYSKINSEKLAKPKWTTDNGSFINPNFWEYVNNFKEFYEVELGEVEVNVDEGYLMFRSNENNDKKPDIDEEEEEDDYQQKLLKLKLLRGNIMELGKSQEDRTTTNELKNMLTDMIKKIGKEDTKVKLDRIMDLLELR
jgi:hypothetical protein